MNRDTENFNAWEYIAHGIAGYLAYKSDLQDISLSALSKTIKSKLLSGKIYSRKKSNTCRKITFHENIVYTQLFIDYLFSERPSQG